jgi:hypothetical protein
MVQVLAAVIWSCGLIEPYPIVKRLTGGTPSGDTGIFSIRHICSLLRMSLEENSIKFKFGWARKYPQTAHDFLGQVYFRGREVGVNAMLFPILYNFHM